MTGVLLNLECTEMTIGGVEDHVHITCNLTKKHAPMKVLEYVKKDSSKWMKMHDSKASIGKMDMDCFRFCCGKG